MTIEKKVYETYLQVYGEETGRSEEIKKARTRTIQILSEELILDQVKEKRKINKSEGGRKLFCRFDNELKEITKIEISFLELFTDKVLKKQRNGIKNKEVPCLKVKKASRSVFCIVYL